MDSIEDAHALPDNEKSYLSRLIDSMYKETFKPKKFRRESESSKIWMLALCEKLKDVDEGIKGFYVNLLHIKDLGLRYKLTHLFLTTNSCFLDESLELSPRYQIIYTLGCLLLDIKADNADEKEGWSVLIRAANNTRQELDYRNEEKLIRSLYEIFMNESMNAKIKKTIIKDVILGGLKTDIESLSKKLNKNKNKKSKKITEKTEKKAEHKKRKNSRRKSSRRRRQKSRRRSSRSRRQKSRRKSGRSRRSENGQAVD